MQLFKIIVNWTPKIWLPLAIVLLDRAITIVARQHLLAYLDLDLLQTSPYFQSIGGFFAIAGALIDWILISTLLFFGCRLLYNREGVFQNFFKIIGMCYLVLLVATISYFIVISISLRPDSTTLELTTLPRDLTTLEYNRTSSQERSEAITETLASLKLPAQLIHIVGHVCFVLILVAVVQAFFEIKWIQAFCITCISYAIYWVLNEALWYIFSSVLLFFYQQFFGLPSWQPGDPILP